MMPSAEFMEAVRPCEPAVFSRVRLRARRRALWLRVLWSSDQSVRNLAITHEEADRGLADPSELQEAEASFYETNNQAREMTRLIAVADEDAASDSRWCALQRIFGLTEAESDLLALAVMVGADPGFGRICGYLQDDATACYATPLLAAALFGWPAGLLVTPDSALGRWRLAFVPESTPFPSAPAAPWVADSHIVQWVREGQGTDPDLGAAAELVHRSDVSRLECLDPATLQEIGDFIAQVRGGPAGDLAVEIELIAPEGAGKRTLATQVCASLGRDLLVVDAQALLPKELSSSQTMQRIVHTARAARLYGSVLYWSHAESLDRRARNALAGLCDLTFFGSEVLTSPGTSVRAARRSFPLEPLRPSQRLRLWRHFTAEPAPDEVAAWELRPAEIRAAAQVACAGPGAVMSVCRRMLRQVPDELFTSLKCPYIWDDIVLPAAVRQQLEELAAQARLGVSVLDNWGFERLCRMGRGVSALFAGASGTGKTMAAQVVARELNRELLRVDLAGVVNKYIGETEKRLKQVFDLSERSAVVLFFDEADALFGHRTQVKDAHDRYANIQVDYLLQLIEQFDGIAILATNRKNDLDNAFLRRLRFIVDFHPPGPSERLTLWRLALPERSPSGEELLDGIEWDWLADNMVMTGAEIKATALAAAFLARTEGSRIRVSHLVHAARREMAKHGTTWRVAEWKGKPHV